MLNSNTKKIIVLYVHVFLSMFLMIMLFHWFSFESILISSIYSRPIDALSFYLPKIAASLFFVALLFLHQKKWMMIVAMLILNIWMIANLIYLRSYNTFLDIFAIKMAGNLQGFWSSVLFYLKWTDIFLFIPTIYLSIYLSFCNEDSKCEEIHFLMRLKITMLGILLAYCVNLLGVEMKRYIFNRDMYVPVALEHYFNPFSQNMRSRMFSFHTVRYVREYSILHQLGVIVNDFFVIKDDDYSMTDEDNSFIDSQNLFDTIDAEFQEPLIIVVFESLEDWAINPIVTPHLSEYMLTHNYLRSRTMMPQVAGGNSMDGQMIINTGLLPISEGAVPYTFPHRKLPGIARCCSGSSAVIVPHDLHVWNQQYMSYNFGYDTTVCVNSDREVFEKTIELRRKNYQMIQCITISSHAPFVQGADSSSLVISDRDMPNYLSSYVKAVHYTDCCMKPLFDAMANDSCFDNATLLIAGDHTILSNLRKSYVEYVKASQWDWDISKNSCGCVFFSPNLSENVIIENMMTYQMDIYPTLLAVLDTRSYWKGVGCNMLSMSQRNTCEDDAKHISDMIIRSDYFDKYIADK